MADFIPTMQPAPGERLVRYVGDKVKFVLQDARGRVIPDGWEARVRTTIGRGNQLRREIVLAHSRGVSPGGIAWRDIAMKRLPDRWELEIWLTEPGFYKAKAFAIDPRGWQHWPTGPDVGISVHPNEYRTGNIIYCAFPRLFGPKKHLMFAKPDPLNEQLKRLDEQGYTVIPPSGKLRELKAHLGHIFDDLGCRILHLLPIMPTPTTYARFGRCGSPYASTDLVGIDPALIEFDRKTTGVDQFMELAYEVHAKGGRLFLDVAINHTGWESILMRDHPDWFQRLPDGTFISPGAWGVTWEDLVELKHDNVALWDELVEVFLTWCRRGVDGFRCDAGYKVPVTAWQYIIASVQQEFPNTVFLLEGLGGPWETTELLLTEGGMQWAYSELFQNYSGSQVAWYLDYALKQSQRVGTYVHYAETHDNPRLASLGRDWALLRTRLCALTSVSGAFGFTCGVEWLAQEKIDVHEITGLGWGNTDNIVKELATLNRVLSEHPCFFDGARLQRLSPPESPVYALLRVSADGRDRVLVLVNTDLTHTHLLEIEAFDGDWEPLVDLLGQRIPEYSKASNKITFRIDGGKAYCLANTQKPHGLPGTVYRRKRGLAAWALSCAARVVGPEHIDIADPFELAEVVDADPLAFLCSLKVLPPPLSLEGIKIAIKRFQSLELYPTVAVWKVSDRNRVLLVPTGHWLAVMDSVPFRATLKASCFERAKHIESVQTAKGFVGCFEAPTTPGHAELILERYGTSERRIEARVLFVDPAVSVPLTYADVEPDATVLITNGAGGICRMRVDIGKVLSKYDCILGANLARDFPGERHILCSRMRIWVSADGFLSELNCGNLISFSPGPPAVWHFRASAGDGRAVEIKLTLNMVQGANAVVMRFTRLWPSVSDHAVLPKGADVRLTVRFDLEDRNFHFETHRTEALERFFVNSVRPMTDRPGFCFEPGPDRCLRVWAIHGIYHDGPEWSHVFYPVEAERGLVSEGDLFSPGWFELPLILDDTVSLVVSAERGDISQDLVEKALSPTPSEIKVNEPAYILGKNLDAYIVPRSTGKTVIAGYPWFLDWGRDALIFVRGLLAAGKTDLAKEIFLTIASYERDGILPNNFAGVSAGNWDTSDTPLWLVVVCEELANHFGENFLSTYVRNRERTVLEILIDIVSGYLRGTPNGIKVDQESGLVWSPSHFTWMDTNYPACTPREGYPIEIQALWIRALLFLSRIRNSYNPNSSMWAELAHKAREFLEKLFWIEDLGWYADVLTAPVDVPASKAEPDDALRPNFLIAIALGVLDGTRARKAVMAARDHLVVPGGIRSLAPLPVKKPLLIYGANGHLLVDPHFPYRGRYVGPEDTARKLAYHNGTAWCWLLPVFCECISRLWPNDEAVYHAAKCYLGSAELLIREGCLGHLPEICDGDAPHQQRGCDAQAWSLSEFVRVWHLLRRSNTS